MEVMELVWLTMGVGVVVLLVFKVFEKLEREPPKALVSVLYWIMLGLIVLVSLALTVTRGCNPEYRMDY